MAVKFLLAFWCAAVFDNIKAAASGTFKSDCHGYHSLILLPSVTHLPLPNYQLLNYLFLSFQGFVKGEIGLEFLFWREVGEDGLTAVSPHSLPLLTSRQQTPYCLN